MGGVRSNDEQLPKLGGGGGGVNIQKLHLQIKENTSNETKHTKV